ncbi:polysaccharide deacetylase family protein [Pelotomaculum propionicicum]|uniref:polysaccharide deacetylase family protein n=1 Tax=Pelotomaculum propionicicum TaxID=258475 RepID=UPI003B80FDE8
MIETSKLLQDKQYLWELFIREDEYYSERPEICTGADIKNKCLEILVPEISKYLVENKHIKLVYPDNKKFALCITHDVDDVYPPFPHRILSSAHCLKDFDLNGLREQWSWIFRGKEFSPYLNFKKIIELEKEYKAKSTFYFLVSNKDPKRFRYNIGDLASDLKYIIDSGWDIGLHGGYYTYNDFNDIKEQKNKLEELINKEVTGYRNHYLRFKVPETWELLKTAGFKYDTTYGYNNIPGFKNGLCHPFKPFNLNSNKEIDIIEIPLNIMACALYKYAKSDEKAWVFTKALIDTVEKYSGVLTINWHNDDLFSPFRKDWTILYKKILEYCRQKNAWMTSCEDIWRWWANGRDNDK